MDNKTFQIKKEELVALAANYLLKDSISEKHRVTFINLLELLNEYTFDNRFQKKGLLSHTVIDSLVMEYSLGEKIISFDNSI